MATCSHPWLILADLGSLHPCLATPLLLVSYRMLADSATSPLGSLEKFNTHFHGSYIMSICCQITAHKRFWVSSPLRARNRLVNILIHHHPNPHRESGFWVGCWKSRKRGGSRLSVCHMCDVSRCSKSWPQRIFCRSVNRVSSEKLFSPCLPKNLWGEPTFKTEQKKKKRMEDGRSLEKFAGFLTALGVLFGLSVKIKCKYLFDPSDWGGSANWESGWLDKKKPSQNPTSTLQRRSEWPAHFCPFCPIATHF